MPSGSIEQQLDQILSMINNAIEDAFGLLAQKPTLGDNEVAQWLTKTENAAQMAHHKYRRNLVHA